MFVLYVKITHLAGPTWSCVARHHISGDEGGIALMTATFGKVEEFDSKKEEWSQYVERLQHFFVANDIVDAEKKRAVFLSLVGPATYKLLGDLLAPAKPGDKSYDELVEVVMNHCNPTQSEIVERFKIQETRRISSDVRVQTEIVGEIL